MLLHTHQTAEDADVNARRLLFFAKTASNDRERITMQQERKKQNAARREKKKAKRDSERENKEPEKKKLQWSDDEWSDGPLLVDLTKNPLAKTRQKRSSGRGVGMAPTDKAVSSYMKRWQEAFPNWKKSQWYDESDRYQGTGVSFDNIVWTAE
jgi:hypothetical protein